MHFPMTQTEEHPPSFLIHITRWQTHNTHNPPMPSSDCFKTAPPSITTSSAVSIHHLNLPCLVWHYCGRDLPTNDFVVQRISQPHFPTSCVVGNVNHQGTSSEHVPPLVMIGQSVKPNIDSPLDLRGMLYRWEVSSQTHQCCVSCQNYCLSS